ncbi:MAG: hypothetical protein AAFV07_19390, partial [Bacteroidota bacterium]
MKKHFLLVLALLGTLGLSAQGLTLYGVRIDSNFVVPDLSTGDLELLQVNPLTGAVTSLFSIPNT